MPPTLSLPLPPRPILAAEEPRGAAHPASSSFTVERDWLDVLHPCFDLACALEPALRPSPLPSITFVTLASTATFQTAARRAIGVLPVSIS